LRQSLPVFRLAAVFPRLVVDDALWPGLPYAFSRVGLDRLDDWKFLRTALPFRHIAILMLRLWIPCASMEYFLSGPQPALVWNRSFDIGAEVFW
jgi:hypothetical protein